MKHNQVIFYMYKTVTEVCRGGCFAGEIWQIGQFAPTLLFLPIFLEKSLL